MEGSRADNAPREYGGDAMADSGGAQSKAKRPTASDARAAPAPGRPRTALFWRAIL